MTDKQINKWLRRRFTVIGWGLLVYYGILNLLAMATIFLDSAIQTIRVLLTGGLPSDVDFAAIASNAWGYILTVAVGMLILYAWKGIDFWEKDILAKEKPMTPYVFFCLLSLCIGSQMVNTIWISVLELILNQFGLSAMGMLESVSGDTESFSMFLYASLLAPVVEELMFRGYILGSLRPYGKRFAIVMSAFLFGMFHGNLLQTPYAFMVGLVLGYVTVEYSIGWAVAIHLFNNLVLADLLSRAMSGLSETAAGMINLALFGGFAVVSGVILWQNRSQIRSYNRSEWIDRRCVKCFFTCSGVLILTLIMAANMILLLFL